MQKKSIQKFLYKIRKLLLLFILAFIAGELYAQMDTVVYRLTIDKEKVTIKGKESNGMTINDSTEYGWNKNLDAELSYERYLYDYFRIFVGINVENETENNLDEVETTAVAGIRYLTPYLFNLDIRFDNKLRPQIGLSREVLIFPRTALFGEFEYQTDFGWIEDVPELEDKFLFVNKYRQEITWNLGLEYFLSKNFTVTASYDNRFGVGGGLAVRF